MKFKCEITVNAPINLVSRVFENPDSMIHYQDGFVSKQLISGEKSLVGAISNIVYEKLELKETILINDLPEHFKALYEHKHMINTMTVWFKPISEEKTIYISEIEYTKFNGFIAKTMAKLFPGMFKKQVYKWMTQFKNYTESLEY